MPDNITIKILEDGTIKTETDKVSMANHSNAEAFLRDCFRKAGGAMTRILKGGHSHEHGHSHGAGEHQHHH